MDVYQEAEQLRKVPMFEKLDASRLKLLAFTSEAVTFKDGEALCRVNDPSDCAFVVMNGEVEILAETEHGEVIPIANRGKNELIGEMAAITNAPRSATVRAKGTVDTLRIGNETFLKLISENPDVAADVMRQLSERLVESLKTMGDLTDQLADAQKKITELESGLN